MVHVYTSDRVRQATRCRGNRAESAEDLAQKIAENDEERSERLDTRAPDRYRVAIDDVERQVRQDMKSNSASISRRGFLATSAAAGALGCASGIRASGSALDIEQSSQGGHGGEDALVAPQYRGFVKT